MKLTNKQYDVFKIISTLIIPIVTFITALTEIWGFEYGAQIAATAAALGTLVGVILNVSSSLYYKYKDDEEEK